MGSFNEMPILQGIVQGGCNTLTHITNITCLPPLFELTGNQLCCHSGKKLCVLNNIIDQNQTLYHAPKDYRTIGVYSSNPLYVHHVMCEECWNNVQEHSHDITMKFANAAKELDICEAPHFKPFFIKHGYNGFATNRPMPLSPAVIIPTYVGEYSIALLFHPFTGLHISSHRSPHDNIQPILSDMSPEMRLKMSPWQHATVRSACIDPKFGEMLPSLLIRARFRELIILISVALSSENHDDPIRDAGEFYAHKISKDLGRIEKIVGI